MRRAEWMVERPWRLVVLVLLVAAPLLILAELAAADTQRRVETEQRENLRSLAARGAEATASRTGSLLDKLVGAATTSRLRGAIGLTARPDIAAPREVIEPPDLRELSFQLDSFHAVMRDDVATLFALDGGGVVLETDPPGGSADNRVTAGKDLIRSPYASALLLNADARFVGVDPETRSLVVAVPLVQQARYTLRTSRAGPGALVAELRSSFLQTSLRSLVVSVSDLYVVDGQGRLLARLNGESPPLQDLHQHPAVTAALSGKPFLDKSSDPLSNQSALVATAPVGDFGWHIVAVAREDPLKAEVDAGLAQQRGLRVGLIAVLLLGAALVGGASSAAIRQRREASDALERQTAVSEVLKIISRSPVQLDEVFRSVIASAVRLCRADNGTMMQIANGRGFSVAHAGLASDAPSQKEYWSTEGLPLDRSSLTGRVLLERRTIAIADIFTEPDLVVRDITSKKTPGPRPTLGMNHSMLGVPLLRGDEVVGVILLRRREIKPFTDADAALAETFADQAVIAIENVRLFNETKEALDQQTATADVLKTISRSAFDLQAVFDVVVENATKLCRGEWGYLFRKDGDVFRLVATHGGTPELIDYERAHPTGISDRTLIGRVALRRGVVHIPDLFEDPDYDWPSNREHGVHTVLGVPIFRGDEVVGAIGVARNERRPFSEADIRLVQTFADQATIAMENVRLFNETKEALEQQSAVAEVLGEISHSGFQLQPVLASVIAAATKLCAAQQGFIYRREGAVFRLVVAHGINPEFKAFTEANPINPMGRGTVTGRVAEDRKTVHIPDVLADPDYTYWEAQRLGSFRAILGVPMMRDDEVIGVMLLWRTEPQPFTDDQIALVTTFANQATIAIENVRLFDETKEALERQSAVSDVLKTLSRTVFDLAPTLQTVVENAAKLANADVAWMSQRVDDQSYKWGARYGRTPDLETRFEKLQPLLSRGVQIRQDRPSIMARVYTESRTITVPDIQADSDLLDASPVVTDTGSRSLVGVPVLTEGIVAGAIVLGRLDVRPFSEREIELVESFADQAAIAIRNVRLFNETNEALERQTAISEVLKVISRSTFDILPVMETVLAHAARLCDADLAWMRRVDSQGALYESANYGRTSELTERLGRSAAESREAYRTGRATYAKSIMARVVNERTRIHVHDIALDPELYENSTTARLNGARTILAVPLLHDGNPVGMLVVARMTVRPFGDREQQLVDTFAQQAAIAMQNARLFKEIQDKSGQLEAANRHKSEFLANMSHELRTPLNAIIGFSEVLIQGLFGDVNEKQREYLRDVIGSGEHLLSLINDILDLSKVESGRMELELSTFSFRGAIDSGLTIVRERAARHNVTLSVVVSDELGQIEADERKVKQIFFNLLSNAVKFTPDGGRVDISVLRVDGDARVEVSDNGIGIAEADQARIFEEFQQVGRERAREGTGLGLTLTKRFVELHGGRIWVESAPGQGSTFAFTLPIRQTAPVRA